MIPQRDSQIIVSKSWAVYGLVVLSTLVFFASQFSASSEQDAGERLIELGALTPALLWKGEIWRLFSAIFVHSDFIHYALNTFVLLQVGRLYQHFAGGFRLVFVFLIAGAGGFALSILTHSEMALGSSGAVFGLIGALLGAMLNLPKARIDPRLLRALLFFVAINIALSILANTFLFDGVRIDNASHLGGLFFGLVFGFVFVCETPIFQSCASEFKTGRRRLANILLVVGLVSLLAIIGIAVKPVFLSSYHETMALEAIKSKDFEGASLHARWLEKSPDSTVDALVIYARLSAQQGEIEQASNFARRALKKWPGDVDSFFGRAVSRNLFSDIRGNALLCAVSIEAGAKGVGLLNDCAWLLLSTHDEKVRDPKKGLEWILRAVKPAAGLHSAVYHTLAEAYLQNNQRDEAIHAIERGIVKGDPDAQKDLQRLLKKAKSLK
jgi:membrane associated rhomboid family serine protease